MKAPHTSGPWSIGDPTQVQHDYPKRYVSESVSVHGPERACVATVYAGHEGGSVGRPYVSLEDGRGNARLIAAAPELLAAAKAIVAYVIEHGGPNDYAALNDLSVAIAKAEGAE